MLNNRYNCDAPDMPTVKFCATGKLIRIGSAFGAGRRFPLIVSQSLNCPRPTLASYQIPPDALTTLRQGGAAWLAPQVVSPGRGNR